MPKGTKALVADHKLVFDGSGFNHSNDYLSEAASNPNEATLYRQLRRTPGPQWRREIVPVWVRTNTNNKLTDLTQTKSRNLSFFFREIDAPVELFIDNIGDTSENCSEMPEWTVGNEAEPIR